MRKDEGDGMPKTVKSGKTKKQENAGPCHTNETQGYLSGLYADFTEQVTKYTEFVNRLLSIQARVELSEKNLANTREYFITQIAKSAGAVPEDWSATVACARFVGARLSDACLALLKEHRRLTPNQLLNYLNNGNYRFRTHTPFREIHGALLKHQSLVQRDGEDWTWVGPDPQLQLIGPTVVLNRKAS
jgi:hypothetical protein